MAHRLDPLFDRIFDEHREFLAHGAGIPIRRVPVDAGTVEICGDQAGLDRRGRHAVTYVRPDRLLVILDLVDEADAAENCVQYQHAELEYLEPYTVLFRGKPRHFQATSKSFLMGVCDCGDATILVAGLDGGLAFSIHTREGWTGVLEPRPSWTTPVDLDAELGERRSRARKPRAKARAGREASAGSRARARDIDAFDDEVREHHARLCHGVMADPDGLEILAICLEELSRQAMLPHDCFEGNHKSRKHIDPVVAGILYAVGQGCGDLGGCESDMLAQLRCHGVVLPPGSLSGVLRLFHLLGCPLVSQPKPAKNRKFSKRWHLDVRAALNKKSPKHLELVRWMQTPLYPCEPDESQDRDGDERDEETDEPGRRAAPASPQGPAESPGRAASEPDGEAGVGAGPSARRTRSTVLPAQLEAFMQLTLGALTLLASQMAILHQRVEATELAASQAVRGRVETATAAEENGEPAASFGADPPVGAETLETAIAADRRIDLNATTTADVDERPGDPFPARGLVETAAAVELSVEAAALLDDVLNANTSLRAGDERDETAEGVDAELSTATGADGRIDFNAASTVDANERPGQTGLNDVAADPLAGAQIKDDVHDDVWPDHADSPSHAITGPHEANVVPLLNERTLALERWNFATVMFLVMFELEDPTLVRRVVIKVVAWMAEAEAEGRVELTCATFWPRARNLPAAHPQVAGLACAERLNASQPWVPAQVELVDAGPRGPPPLGC